MATPSLSATQLASAPYGHSTQFSRAGVVNSPRSKPPMGIVFHTPGSTWAKGIWDKLPIKEAAVFDEKAAAAFDLRDYQPNYLIGTTGKIFQLDVDSNRTQHAGKLANNAPIKTIYDSREWAKWASPSDGSGFRLHGRSPEAVYDWWFAAFPGHNTPLTVFPWKDLPNSAIGVDLLPVVDGNPAQHTPQQHEAAMWLITALAAMHKFPVNKTTVTTHSMCSPVERGTVVSKGSIIGTPWDLPPKQFHLNDLLEKINGGKASA